MGVTVIEESFPKIRKAGYKITSEETPDYNCFAWAMDDKTQWWSPGGDSGYYWPDEVEKSLSVECFEELYRHEGGYAPCADHAHEKGFEKIAIYASKEKTVTHVAKQKPSGKWTSKLGDWEDIEHNTLDAIEGEFYGTVAVLLKRRIPNAKATTK